MIATASGCGKTTFGRALAGRLGIPFHELDALNHDPGWTELPEEKLRAAVSAIVAEDAWVIDNPYRRRLGDLVPESADVVVWLDLPVRVWLPRLVRRTVRRAARGEELWNGNRESLRSALMSRDSLILFALRNFRGRRRRYPVELARFHLVRLSSKRAVDDYLGAVRGVDDGE